MAPKRAWGLQGTQPFWAGTLALEGRYPHLIQGDDGTVVAAQWLVGAGFSRSTPLVISAHRYRVGQVVYYSPPRLVPGSQSGDYTIERLLPPDDSDNQYEIGCIADGQRRVVHERELADSRPLADTVENNRSAS